MTTEENAKPAEHAKAQPTLVFALIALGFAGTMSAVMLTGVVLRHTGYTRSELYDSIGRIIFSYGFPISVIAVVFGLIAVTLGGRSRRLGLGAIALTVAGFLMLFFT